mmetsp:Transcript_19447/g.29904  ORF Transcript_19447/g.29904 Transcript_19447/m.29904 type:complete len:245 (-) Transcript_19447:609-1343(-)
MATATSASNSHAMLYSMIQHPIGSFIISHLRIKDELAELDLAELLLLLGELLCVLLELAPQFLQLLFEVLLELVLLGRQQFVNFKLAIQFLLKILNKESHLTEVVLKLIVLDFHFGKLLLVVLINILLLAHLLLVSIVLLLKHIIVLLLSIEVNLDLVVLLLKLLEFFRRLHGFTTGGTPALRLLHQSFLLLYQLFNGSLMLVEVEVQGVNSRLSLLFELFLLLFEVGFRLVLGLRQLFFELQL